MRPPAVDPVPPPVLPKTPEPPPAPIRAAMPPPAKLRDAEDKIRKARKPEFERRGRAEQLLLAKALLQEGQLPEGDPVQSVALLRLAGELFAEAADFEGLFSAAESIQKIVDAKALDVAEKILERVVAVTKQPEGYAVLVEGYDALSERLVAEDLVDSAVRTGETMEKLARLSTDLGLVLQAQNRRRQLSDLQKAFVSVKAARKTLETRPEDPGACLQVGRFLCFYKLDWEKGIPLLARGSDAALRTVAEQEQAKPVDGAAMAAVGDAWSGWIPKAGTLKKKAEERMLFWYQKAWPQSQGKLRDRLRLAFQAAFGRNSGRGQTDQGMPTGWLEGSAGQVGRSAQDNSVAKTGTSSARVSHALSGNGSAYVSFQTPYLPVAEGEDLLLSGWILSDGTRRGSMADTLRVTFFRQRESRIGASLIELPPDQPFWTFYQKAVKPPPGTTLVIVSVWIDSPEGTVWADDVSLRRIRDRKELIDNGGMEKR